MSSSQIFDVCCQNRSWGSDVDKLAYAPTSNEQVVCEGNTWDKAPITTGVHASGSSCDRLATSVVAMSTSNDGYLLRCGPVTRMCTRPAR
jgi:serine/threonine-protein kinase